MGIKKKPSPFTAGWDNDGNLYLYEVIGSEQQNVVCPRDPNIYLIPFIDNIEISGVNFTTRYNYIYNATIGRRMTPFFNNPLVEELDLNFVSGWNNDYSRMFYSATNLRQVIHLSNTMTTMYATFYNCFNFNCPVQIPNTVIGLEFTFGNCPNMTSRIDIYSTEVMNAYNYSQSSPAYQNTYIYYNYVNGTPTNTYNSFITAGYEVQNLGNAPW